jgi:hypothetical protein
MHDCHDSHISGAIHVTWQIKLGVPLQAAQHDLNGETAVDTAAVSVVLLERAKVVSEHSVRDGLVRCVRRHEFLDFFLETVDAEHVLRGRVVQIADARRHVNMKRLPVSSGEVRDRDDAGVLFSERGCSLERASDLAWCRS